MECPVDNCKKPVHFGIRILIEVLLGSVVNFFLVFALKLKPHNSVAAYLFSIGMFMFISEGIFIFDRIVGSAFPWHSHTKKRVIWLFVFTIPWFILAKFLAFLILPLLRPEIVNIPPIIHSAGMMIGVLVVVIFIVGLIAYNYHQSLSSFTVENERLKQQQLEMSYLSLQDKMNPHFLFNSLSTLIAIIRQDREAAIIFTENLSDIYRYVLLTKDLVLVRVSKEIEFIHTFVDLHRERLGDGLQLRVAPSHTNQMVPPLSLQVLVENAIKHNIASESSPLFINIYCTETHLIVENNRQLKQTSYSTKNGLKNLVERYRLLTSAPVEIENEDEKFIVKLPLLSGEMKDEL